MDPVREPSVEDLRQESERSRAQLANTVENLRDKVGDTATEIKTMVSPAHIKQEIKAYVREERENLVDKMRQNPLQAAAIGAAIAYPAWGLLRAIPMPLMLIGAGLFLTSSRGRQAASAAQDKIAETYRQGAGLASDALADAQDYASDKLAGAQDYASDKLADVQRYASDKLAGTQGYASDKLAGAQQSLSATGDRIKDSAQSVADRVSGAYRSASETVASGAGAVQERIGATAGRVSSAADNAMWSAKMEVEGLRTRSGSAVTDFIEQNPILVAGIGAAVGAAIAASFPASEAENRLFGSHRDALKDTTNELLAGGVEKAKTAAASIAGEIAEAATRAGIDADGFKQAVAGAVTGAKSVADRGLATALDGLAPPISPSDPHQNHVASPKEPSR